MYTPLKPQRRPAEETSGVRWRVPGDIPGSRTHESSNPQAAPFDPNEAVCYTITVDSQEVFSQLSCLAYLGRREFTQSVMFSIQQVGEGHIRIWRHWLSEHCETKTWTDGEPIAIYHDTPSNPQIKGRDRSDSTLNVIPPGKDPSVLWMDSRDENVGIKFRVRERVWRRTAPVSYSSDVEAPVTYKVELEGKMTKNLSITWCQEADIARNPRSHLASPPEARRCTGANGKSDRKGHRVRFISTMIVPREWSCRDRLRYRQDTTPWYESWMAEHSMYRARPFRDRQIKRLLFGWSILAHLAMSLSAMKFVQTRSKRANRKIS